jgi:hypothetical protein
MWISVINIYIHIFALQTEEDYRERENTGREEGAMM